MEELLISLERDRLRDDPRSTNGKQVTSQVTAACNDFAKALHNLAVQFAESSDESKNETSVSDIIGLTKKEDGVDSWLYSLASTIPSPLDNFALASSILSACQRGDEMSIQSGLFDTLGEGERVMEVLFEIMPRAAEISRCVTDEQLRAIHSSSGNSGEASAYAAEEDPEIIRLNLLRQQAVETAEYASLLKVQLDGFSGSGPSATTHTVKRTSDKAAAKHLKKAIKDADKAMAAAKEAGAIVDDDEFDTRGYDASALASEAIDQFNAGIHHMDDNEFKNFQAGLLPEGTKEFHEKRGLPKGTEREYFEGYEMVTIPAPLRDPATLHERIVLAEVMNSKERKAFEGTNSLNPMQSTVFEAAFHSSENLLICAPTGAGKTNVAMLAVVAHLRDKGIIKNENDPYAAYQHIGDDRATSPIGRKIVYIAPMKALAQEIVEKFSSKLKSLGIVVKELTGDMQLSRAEAERADILVTTPEKWDVVTRKGGDGSLAQTCGLLIIVSARIQASVSFHSSSLSSAHYVFPLCWCRPFSG